MALIKLGAIVTQLSGKVGGQQFGQNAGGHYLKNNGTPRKSITLKQQRQMSVMATTAQSWRGLTEMQRNTFNLASPEYPYLNRVGETKFYSGFAIYGMLKNNVLNSNENVNILPIPLPKTSFPPTTLAISTDSLTRVEITVRPATAPFRYRGYCSRPASLGVSNSYKNQTLIFDLSGTQMFNLENMSPYLFAAFGPAKTGTKQYFTLDMVDPTTGQFLKNVASAMFSY